MDTLERIKFLLHERGWSVYRLAQASDINPSTLSNLFARNNVPTIPTLERICEALDITLSEFFAENSTLPSEKRLDDRMEKKWASLTPAQKQLLLELIDQFS